MTDEYAEAVLHRKMTVQEAVEALESRKAFLQQSCAECWPEEMEMALQALKEKASARTIKSELCFLGAKKHGKNR